MLIAANSQPCAVQPGSRLFPSACLRNHDRESAKSGEDGVEDRSDPLRQVGEAGRGVELTNRLVAPSAVSLPPPPALLSSAFFSSSPSPITAAAVASPPAPFLLLEPPGIHSSFLSFATNGGAARFQQPPPPTLCQQPPPTLHRPSLPEQGTQSQTQGRGRHIAALGTRAPVSESMNPCSTNGARTETKIIGTYDRWSSLAEREKRQREGELQSRRIITRKR
ncbi:uncharacterized protein LOC141735450 [Larus michahellis]|uniref:uncharacterized protein LOC141735450 n=1 Tax=Larus michahellis TaxID=119627 RepID=UPI003D9B4FC0